ncbi:hypothetical protein H0E87_013851 [Populus deltoides]|uniref:Uncharacterized protein n=1 Tax=Populus deltoides TaxID=3696 RepID=A0A8T2YB69_POPDE|nr:hypothetical protein H0E87_013851 [Populus deltoides]
MSSCKPVRNSKLNSKINEDATNDLNKVSEYYKSCITDLGRKCCSLEGSNSSSLGILDSAEQESWNGNENMKRHGIRKRVEERESVKSAARALERKAEILIQDRTQLKQKYLTELKRFEEAHERCKVSEEEVKIENAQKKIEVLERQKVDLTSEVDRLRASEVDAITRVALLEAMVKERDQEVESLKMKYETLLSSEKKTNACGKRSRQEVLNVGSDSVQDIDIAEAIAREPKRSKSTIALQKCTAEVENSDFKSNKDDEY